MLRGDPLIFSGSLRSRTILPVSGMKSTPLGTAVGRLYSFPPVLPRCFEHLASSTAILTLGCPSHPSTAQAILTPPCGVSTEEMGCMRVPTDAKTSDVRPQEHPEAGFDWALRWHMHGQNSLSESCMRCSEPHQHRLTASGNRCLHAPKGIEPRCTACVCTMIYRWFWRSA